MRVVYSPLDAVRLARENPGPRGRLLRRRLRDDRARDGPGGPQAQRLGLANFSLLVAHVLVPPAMEAILASPSNRVQGFLAAGHVCTVMGYEEYLAFAARYRVPIVVTGFEPVDLLEGILDGRPPARSGPARGREPVRPLGPSRRATGQPARQIVAEVYEVCDRPWRGLGVLPQSGLRLTAAYRDLDAEARFAVAVDSEPSSRPSAAAARCCRACIRPGECAAFGTRCTPEHPLGAPMVSSEGACAAYWKYGRSATSSPSRFRHDDRR